MLSVVLAGSLVCGFYLESARAISGNEFMGDRRAPESEPQKLFECYACLNGFIDYDIEMVRWCMFKDAICPPDGITVGQNHRVFVKYINAHPESWHETPTAALFAAIGQAQSWEEGAH